MSLTTVQLWQAMQEGKIASAAECRQWAGEILSLAGNAALDDPHVLLSQLVKLGRLTPFQANALLSNELNTLTIGRHKLLAPLASKALADWFEAIDPSSNAARWLYAVSADRLKKPDMERHPPSLALARNHARVRGDGLQSFSPPAFIDDYLLIAASRSMESRFAISFDYSHNNACRMAQPSRSSRRLRKRWLVCIKPTLFTGESESIKSGGTAAMKSLCFAIRSSIRRRRSVCPHPQPSEWLTIKIFEFVTLPRSLRHRASYLTQRPMFIRSAVCGGSS